MPSEDTIDPPSPRLLDCSIRVHELTIELQRAMEPLQRPEHHDKNPKVYSGQSRFDARDSALRLAGELDDLLALLRLRPYIQMSTFSTIEAARAQLHLYVHGDFFGTPNMHYHHLVTLAIDATSAGAPERKAPL